MSVSRIAAGILCVSPRQFSKSDQSKRNALQQLDDTRQLDDTPSDPSMSLLVSPSASCVMAVNSCDSVDTVCLDNLDDDKYLAGEHGQPTVAVAATPTASCQRATSKRKRAAAADASAFVSAVTLAVRTLQQAASAAHTRAPTGRRRPTTTTDSLRTVLGDTTNTQTTAAPWIGSAVH
ncbi:hypothetical protein BC831DRAFT_44973 [Entophlyctis helioformis]|nr:hypothetical protein BC831DRAFT_44973 [Entophlyctis helioformis]